jgi:hypothetical protein
MFDKMTGQPSASVLELVERLESEIPLWGYLPAAMRFKQALVASVGVEEAFSVGREALKVPGLDTVRARPVRSLYETAKTEAVAFHELWGGGNRFILPPPKVIGEGNQAVLHGVDRSAYLACFENVAIRGRSSMILTETAALVDFERNEYSRFADNPEYDPGILHARGDTFWTMEPHCHSMTVEEAFMLSGDHTVDFGHWIIEYLPKYAIAALSGLPDHVPVLIDERMPAAHRQSLEVLLPRGTRIIVIPHLAPAFVRKLWCAPVPANIGFYPTRFDAEIWGHRAREPSHFTTLVREIVRRVENQMGEPTGWDRVYIARKSHLTKKKLLNFREIEAIAQAGGFKIVYPEEMSFIDQLRLVRHARYIVGPEGSGTYLAFFARPGTRVCVLSPPYTLGLIDINGILAGVGVDLTIITGREFRNEEFSPFWYDYEIQPIRFAEFLEDWPADSAHAV